MSLFRSFNKSKFQTPLRKTIKTNNSNKPEITIIDPITMERINNKDNNDLFEDNNEVSQSGEGKDSPIDSWPEDFNEVRNKGSMSERSSVVGEKEEELDDIELSLGTALRASRDKPLRRQGKAERLPSKDLSTR